jgi:outer membrane protein
MKLKYTWSIINSLLIICLLIGYSFSFLNEKNSVVFIDNIKAFKEFNMTRDLGKLNEERFTPELRNYDSLVNKMSIIEKGLKVKDKKLSSDENEKYVDIRRKLSIKEKELENIRVYVKNDINKKVWTRLNAYIKEFGEDKKVELIIGAQGSGNIMYGDSKIDYTEEFIKYANFKYEGN